MVTAINQRGRAALALLLILALMGLGAATPLPATAQGGPSDGIVCTTGPTFSLTTQTGYIGTPDDNVVFMWGLSAGSAGFQHPGPVLCVTQGDTVTVVLHNTLPEAVSLVFPGQENVLANGAPSQPQLSGSTITSLAPAATTGGSMTYSFVANHPGTFLYRSGTNPAKQVAMGLFGALIVRPSRNSATNHYVYQTGANNEYKVNTEFLVLLSEIDPLLNQAVERGRAFNLNNYRPRYFMLNGRGFPDSIAPNFASWLPTQPYGALVRIQPYNASTNPLPALVRYLNLTNQDIPFHPHGNHGRVVGRDGYPLLDGSADLSVEKFVINLGPGQTWDVTTDWRDAESYSLGNSVPVTVPNIQNIFYGPFYGGSPYIGQTGPQPVGATTLNQCGEYYILAHNHSLFQITSWGIPMTGPISYLRIDPPLPNSCP